MPAKKNVTWSPVVTPVSRPDSLAKKLRRRRSTVIFDRKGYNRRVDGNLIAHARRDTHNTLLTIRNSHHRDMQMLIDLPARRVRKIYDGECSWTVDSEASDRLRIQFEKLGTIIWKDDNNTVRKPDARGFALSWLSDSSLLPVRLVERRSTNEDMLRQRTSKRETNYKGASRKRSGRTRKKKSTKRRRRR